MEKRREFFGNFPPNVGMRTRFAGCLFQPLRLVMVILIDEFLTVVQCGFNREVLVALSLQYSRHLRNGDNSRER